VSRLFDPDTPRAILTPVRQHRWQQCPSRSWVPSVTSRDCQLVLGHLQDIQIADEEIKGGAGVEDDAMGTNLAANLWLIAANGGG
jgi:hypothetical protein